MAPKFGRIVLRSPNKESPKSTLHGLMESEHEKYRFRTSIPSVQPFPTTNKIPVGTMASADFCPISDDP